MFNGVAPFQQLQVLSIFQLDRRNLELVFSIDIDDDNARHD